MRFIRAGLVTALIGAAALFTAGDAGAATCGGLLQPPCPPPPPGPPPPPPVGEATVTLTPVTASRRLTDPPKLITFSGAVSGIADPSGLTVELEVRARGYGADNLMVSHATMTTKPDGTFTFQVQVTTGIDVRARIADGQRAAGSSPVRSVIARSRGYLDFNAVGRKRARFVFRVRGPGLLPLARANDFTHPKAGDARRAYLYVLSHSGHTARRIVSGRVRSGDCYGGQCYRSASGTFLVTRSLRRARTYFACTPEPVFVGVQDASAFPECGRRRLH